MKTINEVHLVGNLGKDAERYGNGPVKFSVATGGGTNQKTGKTYPVDWHNCQVWDSALLDVLKKGTRVELTGRLAYEQWDDKKTGEKKIRAVVVAQKVDILAREDRQEAKASRSANSQVITDDDIPF